MKKTAIIDELRKQEIHCTGCSACKNVCPTDAVQMIADKFGFKYPQIDSLKCIDCAKCIKVCPVLSQKFKKNDMPIECYAVQASDELRSESSSGGAFSVFAEEILNRNGMVCGATMDKNIRVFHMCIDKKEDLKKLRKSKYVQSEIGNVFREIKSKLKDKKEVLFSGTPCQVAGLYNFLDEKPDNLLTIDILCHGVPSEKMLKDSLQEFQKKNKINYIDFRDKDYGWECLAMTISFEDGSKRRLSYNESRYEQGFHPNMTLRESCFSCKFCEFPRVGDISIGDFWSIYDYDQSYMDSKGTSALTLNTKKGREFFEMTKSKFVKCKEFPIEALNNNRISKNIVKDASRDYFFELYEKKEFNQAVYYAQQRKYDIGIVGNWSYPNFGSALTYYCLYNVLKSMGYAVGMVSWPNSSQWRPYENQKLFIENPYKEYEIISIPETREELFSIGEKCETFILGSDQLLNNNLYHAFNKIILLDWVPNYKKKIAYASSFGSDFVWGEKTDHAEMAHFLQQFDSFSVREETGKEILSAVYGVEAQTVLDPVFLVDEEILNKMSVVRKDRIPKEKYLFVYMLDATKEKNYFLKECIKRIKLEPYTVTDAAPEEHVLKTTQNIQTEYNVKLEEWVAYIKNANIVITDSFHGMCVAILLKKDFIALVNPLRGATRFFEIAEKLGLQDRLLVSMNDLNSSIELLDKKIDYKKVEKKLSVLKEESFVWLKNSLQKSKATKALNEYDILSRRLINNSQNINKKIKENLALQTKSEEYIKNLIEDLTIHVEDLKTQNEILEEKYKEQIEDLTIHVEDLKTQNEILEEKYEEQKEKYEEQKEQINSLEKKSIGNRIYSVIKKILRK